ncbi:MAG TPA: hypothetical protein VIM42_11450 [Clostridium sp.]
MNLYDTYDDAHRCQGLLDNRCSIRHFSKPDRYLLRNSGWHMFVIDFDSEYDWTGLRHVAKIEYCPFCSKELEDFLTK